MRVPFMCLLQKPKWEKPAPPQALGVVQLLIREVELDSSETCFLLLRCGAQWGRSITLPSSKTHNFNWEVRPVPPSLPQTYSQHDLVPSACLRMSCSFWGLLPG